GQVLDVADGGAALEVVNRLQPGAAVALRHGGQQAREHVADVADDPDVDRDVLVDLGRVDVDVNLLRVRRVGGDGAGHAVVEPHAERDEQIGFLDGGVDPRLAVHAHHAQIQRLP